MVLNVRDDDVSQGERLGYLPCPFHQRCSLPSILSRSSKSLLNKNIYLGCSNNEISHRFSRILVGVLRDNNHLLSNQGGYNCYITLHVHTIVLC